MKKQAFSYLARVGIQKIIGFLLYLIGAGFTLTYAGIVYFVYLFLATIIISWILFKTSEETLAERGKTNTDSPIWDKILLFAFWILNYFIVYLLSGISENSEHLNFSYYLGIVLTLFAAWFSTKATLENTFLESTARIQSDRNQKVCTNCIGLSLILSYVSVWICMAITAVIIVIRTVFLSIADDDFLFPIKWPAYQSPMPPTASNAHGANMAGHDIFFLILIDNFKSHFFI